MDLDLKKMSSHPFWADKVSDVVDEVNGYMGMKVKPFAVALSEIVLFALRNAVLDEEET